MIAELGNYALALSLAVSFFLAILPLWGAEKGHTQLMSLARPMTYGLFFTLTIAFAALFYLFAVNDFSVQYVVNNSNSSLPIYYRLSAVWGSHEGSLLLWIWLLTLWGAAVALFSKHLPQEAVARVWGLLASAFYSSYYLPRIHLPVHSLTSQWMAENSTQCCKMWA